MKFDKSFLKSSVKSCILALYLMFISFAGYSQLSGTYTIDPAGAPFDPIGIPFPNFASFQEAIDSLHAQGVNGAVEINVADGVYTEQVQLNQITGASAANRITFQSQSLDSTQVTLTYESTTSTNYWTLRLSNSTFVTIRKMKIQGEGSSIGRVININGSVQDIIIENCQFVSNTTSTQYSELIWSGNDETDKITIRNNLFLYGTRGIDLDGISTSELGTGLEIYNNKFYNQRSTGIIVNAYDAPKIYNNSVSMTGGTGINVEFCFNTTEVRSNEVIMGGGKGISIYRCKGDALNKCLVANNFVRMKGNSEQGMRTYICEHVNIFHNSVHISNSSTQKYITAFNQDDYSPTGYSSNIELRNNIFANSGGGTAVFIEYNWTITASDHNNLYSAGDLIASWNGDQPDLQSHQDANTMDLNSVSMDPRFLSDDDLHIDNYWLSGMGDPTAGIVFDIDGDPRMSPPDIGADEFEPTQFPIPAGVYKIGVGSPDYTTIKDAFDDLQLLGIAGPVTFEILDGEYEECIGNVKSIPGTSAADTIVFKSESGNPEDVVIFYPTGLGEYRNIFELENVAHITFMDLAVTAIGNGFGIPFSLIGACEDISFVNNILSSSGEVDPVFYIADGIYHDIAIVNNTLSHGSQGIYFLGSGTEPSKNTVIAGNTFEGSKYEGMDLRYHTSPKLNNNVISSSDHYAYTGIKLTSCDQALEIIANSIEVENGISGIWMDNCAAVLPFEGLISNNMIHVGGTDNAYGIWLNDCRKQNVYHNSLKISGTNSTAGRGIFTHSNNEEINIINNIIANTGGGYALYVSIAADITASDNNGFYVTGSNLAYWGGTDYATLGDLQGGSGMDASSLVTEPMFYSETDLRTLQVDFHQAAQSLSKVEIDIDSVMRDADTPDIGAMEFSCGNPDYDIDVSITCFGDSTTFIDKTTGIVPLSVISWDFNNDFEYDYTSPGINDTVSWLLPAAGTNTVNYIIEHFACSPLFTPLSVPVNEPPNLDVTIEGAYCGNGDGEASIEVSGGVAPYDILWSTGSTETSISGLSLGTYTVGVIDQNSCDSSAVIVIEERMVVDVEQLSSSSCGASDGTAIASASGGTTPYKYVWSNSIENASNDSLSPGIHTVYVEDNDGCNVRGVINIESDGSGPEITLVNRENNECYGEHQGVLEIDVTGGSTPYTILWSNGGTTEMIDDLSAGLYDVIVKDQEDCETYASYPLGQGARINIGTVVQESNCASADGKAVAVVSGGTSPYHFLWSSGGVQQIEEDLEAGVYSLTVTDYYGCQMVHPVVVNDIAGPVVSLKSITGVNCAEPAIGAIDINISGGTPLYSYLWATGEETSQDITGLTAGSYSVKATDNAGCVGAGSFDVKEEGPAVQPICIVSVDTLTGKNLMIWRKDYTDNVSHYNIYRETSSSGSYQLIDTVGVNSESIYLDEVADPSIRSWRYKLSVVDVCGEESELSTHHKTMHLTMNKGVGGVVNLIWDHYEGFTVSTYKVWRYDANSNWVNIEDMPSNLTSYTDLTPPNEDLTYYIEVLHPGGCEASEKKPGRLNSSKSNRKSSKKSGTKPESIEDLMNITEFSIYPNPGTGIFNLDLEKEGLMEARIKVYDITGKVLSSAEYFNIQGRIEKEIDLSGYADGLYQVQIEAGNAILHRILIKE